MEALEYVKAFKMDQPNYSFDRHHFIETFGNEFKEFIEDPNIGVDPETGRIPYSKFKEVVKNFEGKFNSISEIKPGKPLSRGLWGAFYAIWVLSMRKKLFPEIDKKIIESQTKAIANNPLHPKHHLYKDKKDK